MRRCFGCRRRNRPSVVQPEGPYVHAEYNKMLTPRQHSVGVGLQIEGIFICILQAVAAAVLPALSFLWVYNGHMRLSVEAFVHWGISTAAALLGVIGLSSLSSAWLSMHVVLGGLAAAALAAHDTVVFGLLELRCSMRQVSSAGCDSCACAVTDTCSQSDLSAGPCSSCQAYSTDLCSRVGSNTIIIAITGAVTLVTMALPVIVSLLALLRVEHYRRAQAERLQQDRGALAQQTRLLEDGHPLSISQDAMQASISMLMGSRSDADHDLARRAAHALQLHTSVPGAIASKQLPSQQSLAADLPGLPGTIPVYTPSAADAEPLRPPSAPLVPLPPKKSSLMGIKSAVVSTTLLATQALGAPLEAFRRKSSSAGVQMAPQEAEYATGEGGGSRTVMLPGDEEMGESLQAAEGAELDEPGHRERSHSKGRKHHGKKHSQPADADALNLMSSTYGAAKESFARPKRQQSMAAARRPAAEQESGSGEDTSYI